MTLERHSAGKRDWLEPDSVCPTCGTDETRDRTDCPGYTYADGGIWSHPPAPPV
jgi:hypothetical protein